MAVDVVDVLGDAFLVDGFAANVNVANETPAIQNSTAIRLWMRV